jgi:hypothetical protein
MWGALFDERTRLSFVRVTAVIRLLSVSAIYILHVLKYMYIKHIQELCQSRLSTADHALSLVDNFTFFFTATLTTQFLGI